MAVRFYKIGDAERSGGAVDCHSAVSANWNTRWRLHNFAAGVEMTMTSVVTNYLRWFKLNSCKKVICESVRLAERRRGSWLAGLRPREPQPAMSLPIRRLPRNGTGLGNCDELEPARSYVNMVNFADTFSGRQSKPPEPQG